MKIEQRGNIKALVTGDVCRPATPEEVELCRQNKEMEQAIMATFEICHNEPTLNPEHIVNLLKPIIERIQQCE